ncbi:cytochrome P450 [Streptomyces tagetis]|uniref:Cytochrome P450 n=1 Tax=Streptomyces tagetis TaxID=2820809 RepID=A0A941B092_9ACTN|nr:cytochrome P450 [Streptomyces sp. RG38]MBQ0829794.1 cytochrome P450 [Streptomyces sp. RG38]
MTPERPFPTGPDDPTGPPPGCPAHGLAAGGPGRLAEADDLEALYERLRREHGPVAPVLLHDDVPMWVVLGHAENLHMISTPALFCRDSRIWSPLRDGLVKPDHPLMPHIAWQPVCSHAEGTEHQRLRGAVTSAMAPIDYRSLRRHITRHTQRLVNRFCEEGRADLVAEFAEHLPMGVMCELLGMPNEYGDRMVEAARDTLKGTETAIDSHAFVMAALGRLTARRRARPEDDIASRLVTHPAGLSDDEVREHLRVVLLAAYEATVNLIGNVLRVVLTDPGFRAQLSGGQMTVPEAVEQSLWDEPPFSTVLAYFAKQDTELGGRRIRKGDGLLLGIAPGNVDPRIRPDPAAGMQGNRSHLAFGAGPHECPGQDIGRAIADCGVDALLMRLPDIQLDCDEEELRWRSSIASRHLVELPVYFGPRPPQAVTQQPSHTPVPQQRTGWQVGSRPACPEAETPAPGPAPEPEPALAAVPAGPAPGAGEPGESGEPRAPRAPGEGHHPPGAWQRLQLWWRGY